VLGIVDYGAGNLRSVVHAVTTASTIEYRLVRVPQDLHGISKLILPGVGAFCAGMAALRANNLVEPLQEMLHDGTPYLGICLGMQFLFTASDEMEGCEGLGVIPGRVVRFPSEDGRRVPHIGWNAVHYQNPSPLWAGIADESDWYFVHSYYCVPDDAGFVAGTTQYPAPFTSSIWRDNLFGVQFHPEKSQAVGLRLIRNFLDFTS
jgi:imidazole glycerol-phosphate synthase subunit HisH